MTSAASDDQRAGKGETLAVWIVAVAFSLAVWALIATAVYGLA